LSFLHIFRILWARRFLVFSLTLSCLLGGVLVMQISDPRYRSTARVMLEVLKPDRVTGFFVEQKEMDAYVTSQAQIIRDVQVAGRVVEQLGWLDNPDIQAAFAAQNPGGDQDLLRVQLARRIIGETTVELVPETNILEISYRSTTPESARMITDMIRQAYVDASTQNRRESARAGADTLEAQAERTKTELVELEAQKAKLERESGLLLQGKNDMDERKLGDLANVAAPKIDASAPARTPAQKRLAEIDASIAGASRNMGPGHPLMIQLRQQREVLLAQAQREQALSPPTPEELARQKVAMLNGEIMQQMLKVASQRGTMAQLHLLQDQIGLRKEAYDKLTTQMIKLRELSSVGENTVTPLGPTDLPTNPDFPKKGFIAAGTTLFGLAAGVMVALLAEFMGRRVRTRQDMEWLVEAPLLAEVPNMRLPGVDRAAVAPGPKAKAKRADRPARWPWKAAKA
jgi:uncharacterized protein involved in exopolysaccharide biosynthesis